jgi:hypothetical protein
MSRGRCAPVGQVVCAVLLVAAARTSALAQDQAGSLAYEVPSGWIRTANPATGVTSLAPSDLPPGRVFVLTIFSPEPFAGPAEAFHDEIVRRATWNARPLEPPRRGTAGPFLVTAVRQLTAAGVQLWVTVYTARWSDRGQALVLAANAEDVARAYAPVADAMVRRISVPRVALGGPEAAGAAAGGVAVAPSAAPPCQRPTGIEICPKPVPSAGEAVPIVGAYIATAARTSYSADPQAPGVRSRVGTHLLLLFANGVAARSSAMKSGAMDDTYWAEGLATMDPRDPSQLGARRVGRWSESGGTVAIAWQTGAPTTLTREGRNLREKSTLWTPYPSVDGLRLEGRYERAVSFGPPWSITLRKDGTFTSEGVNNTMGGTTVNPGFPEHGSGTYEIRRWSLILRFTTGFVQSINLMLGQGDRTDPHDLVLNGYDFVRTSRR